MKYSKKYKRLRAAIKYRLNIDMKELGSWTDEDSKTLNNFFHALHKRAKSDRQLDSLFTEIAMLLEPPNCTMSHCTYFSVYGPCNCTQSIVPSKCNIYKDYQVRKVEQKESLFIKFKELFLMVNDYSDTNDVQKILIRKQFDEDFKRYNYTEYKKRIEEQLGEIQQMFLDYLLENPELTKEAFYKELKSRGFAAMKRRIKELSM
jgi:hypothetical protein